MGNHSQLARATMNVEDEDLKKFVMHSMFQSGMHSGQAPMAPKEELDILRTFSDKEFSDTFHLAIIKKKDEPGRLFSKNALERFLHMLRLYVGGRILGHFDKTAKSPEVVYVTITVEHLTKQEYESLMKA